MAVTIEARQKALLKALEAAHDTAAHTEHIQLPYKDAKEGPFPVVSVPVTSVVFNPRSHRIQSQLESDPKRQIVIDDPFSVGAQDVIHRILAETEDFEELKSNLKEYGQKDAGVVTRDGLLVNANTRLAALRDLGVDYIRAAVLPADADEAAIDRLELELQVQRDFKQDYTFTNLLIFIDQLLKSPGYDQAKVAKALNYAASADADALKRGIKQVTQNVRQFAMIREIQHMSEGAVPLTFFDDKRQALTDLDDELQTAQTQDPDAAERMKYARIAGILSGSKYRDLRKISDDSLQDVLLPLLEEKETLGSELGGLLDDHDGGEFSNGESEVKGDDDAALLAGGNEPAKSGVENSKGIRGLAKLIATTFGKDEIQLPSGGQVLRDEIVNEVAEAIEETAEDVQSAVKAAKNLNNPVTQLEESVKKARAALQGYQQFNGNEAFKAGKFDFFLKKLKQEIAAIEKAIEQAGK